ncbi:MAG: beta-N-acetylhexosaminidase [Coxiellaceae bacterium]|nr:beta-N-acetylhexosaminidase [Coxiellaceae bacterium]
MQPGCLLLDIEGTTLSAEDKELLLHPLMAGVILFERNYEDPQQLKALTEAIYKVRSPLIIGVDQEGGRVQRFHEGFTDIPAMRSIDSKQQLRSLIKTQLTELTNCGMNVNFAPVLDLDDGVSQVIGERSLGATPEKVVELAQVVIAVMNEFNMPAIGKHFPGHGGVSLDTHIEMPVDDRSFDDIAQNDMLVFTKLAPLLSGIMTAHVQFPHVDDLPPTYSTRWLRDILRDQLKFNGVIFSDDLSMQGASQFSSPADRCVQAAEAGCDLLLLCNDRAATIKAVDGVSLSSLSVNVERITRWVEQLRGPWNGSLY